MTMPVKNIIAALFLAAIGIIYGVLASELPDRSGISVPGPAFFPNLISGFLVFLSVALLIKGILGWRAHNGASNGLRFPGKALLLIGWFALFIAVLPTLGFLIAGIPFFAGLIMLCEGKIKLPYLIGAILIPVILFYLFRNGFHILLPHAQWM